MSNPDPGRVATRPSMMDLVRLSSRPLYPPGGEGLYRQIALLTGLSEGEELLEVGPGTVRPLALFVGEYGVVGYGIESDPEALTELETAVRGRDDSDRFHLQLSGYDDLPYRDGIFDVVIGELGCGAEHDPAEVVAELARVAKPGAPVVLVQLVWTAPVEASRREVLGEHLGARPLMLVEWKRLLGLAGIEGVYTEDWSDAETSFRAHMAKPFPDFAELFSVPEKIGILRRAWRRWGWRGVRNALARQREVHRLLTRERILGLYLIKGTRVAEDVPIEDSRIEGGADVGAESDAGRGQEGDVDPGSDGDEESDGSAVRGLPLFEEG